MLLEGLTFFVTFFLFFGGLLTLVCRDASHFNGIDPIKDLNIGHAFLSRLYFTVTTFSTVGFGDITPVSVRARLIVIITVLFFIVVILQSLDNMRNRLLTTLNPMKDHLQATIQAKLGSDTTKAKDPKDPNVAAATAVTVGSDTASPPLTTGTAKNPNMYYVADGGLKTNNMSFMLPSY